MQPDRPAKVCLFGAAGDTGNLGVSALLHSTMTSLYRRIPDLDLLVFHSMPSSVSHQEIEIDGDTRRYRVGMVRPGRRYWRTDNLTTLAAVQRIGLNFSTLAEIQGADVILDLSGGDSFTDTYGSKRFRQIVTPKLMALRARTPLVLLPQTYGEFHTSRSHQTARRIVNDPITTSWSRDNLSHEMLLMLAGSDHDRSRQIAGVDVAFGLQPVPRADLINSNLEHWLRPGRKRPVVGINVSGLLYNDPESATRFQLMIDYRETIRRLSIKLLKESDARLVLMPHVNPPKGGTESDPKACAHLLAILARDHPDRVLQAPTFTNPGTAKWLIGSMDWFLGSRMHSTIAALSSNVVAASLAYSMKTAGVFGSCNMESAVVDGRELTTSEAVERLWNLWLDRQTQSPVLAKGLERVQAAAKSQMDEIASMIEERRSQADV